MQKSSNDWLWLVLIAAALWWLATHAEGGGIIPKPPFPGDGLRVVILEETASRSPINLMTSTAIRDYLKQKNAKWRQWDDDYTAEDIAYMEPEWREAYAISKDSSKGVLPWLIVSNGKGGYNGVLPKTEAEVLSILKEFGE